MRRASESVHGPLAAPSTRIRSLPNRRPSAWRPASAVVGLAKDLLLTRQVRRPAASIEETPSSLELSMLSAQSEPSSWLVSESPSLKEPSLEPPVRAIRASAGRQSAKAIASLRRGLLPLRADLKRRCWKRRRGALRLPCRASFRGVSACKHSQADTEGTG